MKISCTLLEKERILTALHKADICPFMKCKEFIGQCDECCENQIEWQIEDGGQA